VLDASGAASIWLAALLYKIVAFDANGVQQWSVDKRLDGEPNGIAGHQLSLEASERIFSPFSG
jgi:hypothetical protein